MSKESVQKALDKYLAKEAKKSMPKKSRTNEKPEKEVVKKILNWCRKNGFSVNEIEAKAVYNESAGHYIHGQVVAGYPDISGNNSVGISTYIEAKAKGRRSTLKPHQRNFLIDKINTHCFAVCVDNIDDLEFFYTSWWDLYKQAKYKEAQEFLLKMLPKAKKKRSKKEGLDDGLGF